MSMRKRKDLQDLYNLISNLPIPIERAHYTEESNGWIFFYNKKNRMTMMMPIEVYEDILKDK